MFPNAERKQAASIHHTSTLLTRKLMTSGEIDHVRRRAAIDDLHPPLRVQSPTASTVAVTRSIASPRDQRDAP